MPVGRVVGGAVVVAAAIGLSSCGGPVEPAEPPEPSRCAFERDVYPVLARDCGFAACHGDSDRFFRVYAPGRTRLSSDTGLLSAPTDEEIDATYDRARSMLAGAPTPEESLLVRKPLSIAAGGGAHAGLDARDRDVYSDEAAPGWQAIATWARGESTPCP